MSIHIVRPPNTDNAYNADFNNGNINNDNKDNDNNNMARCVRSENKDLFGFENIYKSYIACRKNKRNTINALKFEENLEENIFQLENELKNKTYKPTRSVCFTVLKPKPREVFAADFKDRVIHHLLVEYLTKIFERKFIYDSYACRLGKGTHKAVKRLKRFLLKITKNNTKRAYYLQLDIQNFFMSIDKNILHSLIKKQIKNADILWLSKVIIFHEPQKNYIQKSPYNIQIKVPFHKSLLNAGQDKGLPIGNHSSQFFANVYLNELDQFVKHKLKAKYYLRYVDDFVILSDSKDELVKLKNEIEVFIEKSLLLKLNKKQKLLPVSNGINFLGYVIRPNYILVRKRVIYNFKNKLKYFEGLLKEDQEIKNSIVFLKSLEATANSYFGHFKHADSYKLKKQIIQEFPILKMIPSLRLEQ